MEIEGLARSQFFQQLCLCTQHRTFHAAFLFDFLGLTRGLSSYPHIMNGLNGPTAPKYTFLIFYASIVDGQMWCPVSLLLSSAELAEIDFGSRNRQDCRRVESTVKEAFDGPDKPSEPQTSFAKQKLRGGVMTNSATTA